MLGRFCHADEVLRRHVTEMLDREAQEDPALIFAEVAHVPDGHVGNVVLRPPLRKAEIPYLSGQGAAETSIGITDVLISVQDDRLVLRSKSTGRRIVPRLSTAHSVRRGSLPVYQFLHALQTQGLSSAIRWDWEGFDTYAFLPRVRVADVIVSLARWRINSSEFATLTAWPVDDEFMSRISKWRLSRNMPRIVTLADYDNVLPIDFDNVLSVEMLNRFIKNRHHDNVIFVELFPEPALSPLVDKDGKVFQHECVIPLRVETPVATPSHRTRLQPVHAVERSWVPGSEWLFSSCMAGRSLWILSCSAPWRSRSMSFNSEASSTSGSLSDIAIRTGTCGSGSWKRGSPDGTMSGP